MIVAPFRKVRNAVARTLGDRVTVTSVGRARTDRGARYGKQLCSHLGRKAEATWDDATGTGEVRFAPGAGARLSTTPHDLVITLICPRSRTAELRDVLERHLVKFGARDGLVLTWQ